MLNLLNYWGWDCNGLATTLGEGVFEGIMDHGRGGMEGVQKTETDVMI